MKKYTYLGRVREGADPRNLIYTSNGEVTESFGSFECGGVEVTHVSSGDVLYYSEQQFRKLFKEI